MKWQKPSGVLIETNDRQETVAEAKRLGWKPFTENNDVDVLINAAETKEELEAVAKEHLNIDLDKRMSLDNMRVRALEVLRGNGG